MGVKAIVQTGVRAIEMREFERPAIHDDDALLRIEQSGVCGSDWSQFKMGAPANVIPGHEPIGTIEEVGPLAAARWGVEVGARVAIETMLPCGFCRHCIRGQYNHCRASGPMIHAYGYRNVDEAPSLWGEHAEYMYLDPHTLLHRIAPDTPPELAVMFNPLGAGVRWAHRVPGTGIGDTVVVLGYGQRGLAAVIAAREAGAGTVIVTGLAADEFKLEIAQKFGADHTINVDTTSVIDAVQEISDGEGADVVVEVTSGATEPVGEAIEIVARRGTVVLAGLKYGKVPEFDANKVMSKEIRIQGALAVDYDSYETAIHIIEGGRYPLELMHTHTIPLSECERALHVLGGEVEGEQGIHISLVPD